MRTREKTEPLHRVASGATEAAAAKVGAGAPAADAVAAPAGEPRDSPSTPGPAAPSDPARELRSLAARFVEQVGHEVERLRSMKASRLLETQLAECEAFIRDYSAMSGLGLDYEAGRDLAAAKRERRELRDLRDAELRPVRLEADRLLAIRTRVAQALRRCSARDADALGELALLMEEVLAPLTPAQRKWFRTVHARVAQLAAAARAPAGAGRRRRRGLGPDASGASGESAAATPAAADPSPELLTRYLPPPAALEFEPADATALGRLDALEFDAPQDHRLRRAAQRLSLSSGFEVLLCPPLLRGVEHYDYQLDTARQVMRSMRGRALLCDEVGLGKTIEAGLVLKEYALRGLARRVLVLVPPSLVSQWRDEMADKFGVSLATPDDPEFRAAGDEAWERCERIVVSLHTAKSPRNAERIRRAPWDLIVVDEAHHLRNRASRSWKFVNELTSKYLLLLTATPAQNDLDELFNLITLLAPGQLRSAADFRREFVDRSDPRRPRNHTRLRELLMDVMVRNTRSQVSLRLPPREASTIPVALSAGERALYDGVTRLVRSAYGRPGAPGGRTAMRTLQAEAGSSAPAVRATLAAMLAREPAQEWRGPLHELHELADRVPASSKAAALVELLLRRLPAGEKVLVFTQYLETQALLGTLLERAGIAAGRFSGSLSPAEKDAAIASFADGDRVLISTDVGSEGRNLQFCRTVVNFDLPWNPMRIEQRVGRVHRIGQSEPVRIFNLAAPGTLEGRILEVLDEKINMFELVVGEIGEILGNFEEEREFEDLVLDAWAGADSDAAAAERFAELAERLVGARRSYLESRDYDEALFGQDFAAEE